MHAAFAAIVVFIAAAAVLVLEILAVRLMAPYVGVSLNTYTGIIGTVLAGISAGTWLGGRAADRFGPRLLLGPILIVGGLLSLATAPLVTLLGEHLSGTSMAAVISLSAATVFLPAFVLSAVTPIVVKLQLQDLSATGSVVGRLSAFATAGALVGTYGTGFILAARLPNRTIIVCIGALLIALGLVTTWVVTRRLGSAAAAVTLGAAVATGAAALALNGPCKVESAYFCIQVSSGDSPRALWLDDVLHSAVYIRDPAVLGPHYVNAIAAGINVMSRPGTPVRTLHVGGGAFTLPRYLTATRPGSSNSVMELDEAVVDTAREDFGLREQPRLRIEVGDARLGIADERSRAYDFVIGDAFSSRSVPWHLTTEEFLKEIERVMRRRGMYIMNVIDSGLRFVRAEAATMKLVFPHVALLRSLTAGNHILLGSNAPIDAGAIAAEAGKSGPSLVAVTQGKLDRLIGDAETLDDDFAPVDQLVR